MLVLASASPRRKELLTQAGFEFQVQAADIEEAQRPGEDPIPFATRLAREKAQTIYAQIQENSADPLLVLGADTVVVTAGKEVLGKPQDRADAAHMLCLLSGGTHTVITGVCLVSRNSVEVAAELTYVTMQTLSTAEIEDYIATNEPMDKAGAYAIQGRAARWIPRIHGCYFNVVGLPLALVSSMIEGTRNRLAAHPPAMVTVE